MVPPAPPPTPASPLFRDVPQRNTNRQPLPTQFSIRQARKISLSKAPLRVFSYCAATCFNSDPVEDDWTMVSRSDQQEQNAQTAVPQTKLPSSESQADTQQATSNSHSDLPETIVALPSPSTSPHTNSTSTQTKKSPDPTAAPPAKTEALAPPTDASFSERTLIHAHDDETYPRATRNSRKSSGRRQKRVSAHTANGLARRLSGRQKSEPEIGPPQSYETFDEFDKKVSIVLDNREGGGMKDSDNPQRPFLINRTASGKVISLSSPAQKSLTSANSFKS
ncbi:hypothetical protein BT69DRAFT_1328111 [Atractiella rhizophila]|nr:hypothetical protein BT69DRAFT_1328111 [Atractiella rhizophila]